LWFSTVFFKTPFQQNFIFRDLKTLFLKPKETNPKKQNQMQTYASQISMQKRPKRTRASDEDNFSPPVVCGAAPSAINLDFQSKAREIAAMCERFSLDAQELQTRLKTTTEQVEEKNKQLQSQKEASDAALEAERESLRQLTESRDELDRRFTAVSAEYRAFKTKNATELEKFRRLAQENVSVAEDLRTQLREQQTQAANDIEVELETVRRLTEERDAFSNARVAAERLRDTAEATINAACENFTDCITLQRRAGILLTSGQMLDLEGLLGIWLSKPRFNGDIWFPFECPLTKKTTTPVHELSEFFWFHGAFCTRFLSIRECSHAGLHRAPRLQPRTAAASGDLLPVQGAAVRP